MNKVILPVAIELVVDDVGWHNGADGRYMNCPARSGLPRFHHPDDVRALNAIGEALNMKIICSLVLGEWDRKNILRGVPHVSGNEQGWDAAGEMDPEYTQAYFDALEESKFLDYSLHGLNHGYYENGKLNTARQYYPDIKDEHGERAGFRWLPAEEFDRMVDLFYGIYNEWGFKKDIVTFVSPCGCMGTPTDEGNINYAKALRRRGIVYWCNSWSDSDELCSTVEGMISTKSYSVVTWNAYDVDPDYLELREEGTQDSAVCCFHLTNFVRFNPEKNFEYVPKWVSYFKRQAEVFGYMLARDMAESSTQAMYIRFAKLAETTDGFTIDLTEVDKRGAVALGDEFFVSIRDERIPATCDGGEITLYETKGKFKNYKIKRNGTSKVVVKY